MVDAGPLSARRLGLLGQRRPIPNRQPLGLAAHGLEPSQRRPGVGQLLLDVSPDRPMRAQLRVQTSLFFIRRLVGRTGAAQLAPQPLGGPTRRLAASRAPRG